MWQQRVGVVASRVYEFSGKLKVRNVRGRAMLQVVFRDQANRILQFVDLLPHRATIDWFHAYPVPMLVRAPARAATAEVNLCLDGTGTAWFDDVYFGPPDEGAVSGKVTCDAKPVQGVRVYLHGDVNRPKRTLEEGWWTWWENLVGNESIAVFPTAWEESPWWRSSQVGWS